MAHEFETKIRRDQEAKTKAEILRMFNEIMEQNNLKLLANKLEFAINSCCTVFER